MSFTDDYLANRKKKKKEEKKTVSGGNSFTKEYLSKKDDIAPVASTPQLLLPVRTGVSPTANTFTAPVRPTTKTKDDSRKWFDKGLFDDGYQFGDVTKTILGTAGDVVSNVGAGILDMGESALDALVTVAPYVARGQAYQNGAVYNLEQQKAVEEAFTEGKKWSSDFVAKDLYSGEEIAKSIINTDPYSVLGEKSDSLIQSGGQLLGTVGLSAAGVPWFLTTGVTSFGSEAEQAFSEGATSEEAILSGVVSAGAEILTEKISGGIKFGGKALDDGITTVLSRTISDKTARALAKAGFDMVGEGGEEILSGYLSAIGQKLTYMDDKELNELFTSEEAMDSFIGGAVLGGVSSGYNAVKSNKAGVDSVSGLRANEEAVVKKVYDVRLAEEGDLTQRQKNKLYNSVVEDMDKGYISIDTIEEVLGGDTYKTYRETVDSEDALAKEFEELGNKQNATLAEQSRYNELKQQIEGMKQNSQRDTLKTRLGEEVFGLAKDSRLAESYAERSRRGQAFEADLTQYDVKQQEVVKRAAESGIVNNTRRTHEFVDLISKISADKGVLFDFTNNEKLKESGFAVSGKTVDGYVTKDGITLNMDSPKAWQTTVGHEITHVLEGTELYDSLRTTIFDYAKSKGEYDSRLADIKERYKGIKDADYEAELTSDLVGEYLFADENFIKHLSVENRNVFQKIYDEVKYMLKVVTAGSKEARQLEKVKRAFDKVYKESGKAEGTKYSVSDSDGKQLTTEQQEYFKDSKMRDDNGNLKVMYHGSQDAGFHVFDARMSDDDTSFFFVDRNDVAASYSGTSETYEAKTIRTAEDMNNFLAEIGQDEDYSVSEQDGKFELIYDGDRVASSDTAQGIYKEFCWYEGVGEGDANYKVYLNLTNPLVVDAEGRNWNNISREFSQEVYDGYQSLTAEEKQALVQLAAWEEYSIFRDEMLEARANAEQGVGGVFDEAYTKNLARAYEKLGGANANLYDAFTIASDNFSEDSLREFAVKQMKTRDYAKRAKEQGYDGVIFKNIVDLGQYGGDYTPSTVAVAFDSNQIKSVANEKPTADKDIRYSLSEDSEGRKLSPAIQQRFGNSKVVDENGSLKVVYHGTATGEFSIFDKSKGNVEGDFGSGFYFTDNEADVSEHYEGGGPDFEQKVALLAEQIEYDDDIPYDEAKIKAREQLYKGSHLFEVYLNIENPAIVGKTILLTPESYYDQYNEEDYDSYEDYEGDVEQLLSDDIDNIIWEIERNVDIYSTDGIAEVLWEAVSEGGIGIEELKAKLNNLYLEDNNGKLVANEVARQIIESLGYDGIVDPTVSGKWNMDIEDGTTHYIVFKPNQIKAVTNENPTADSDIHRSLSNGVAPVGKGVPMRDLRLETGNATVEEVAPVAVARVQDTVRDTVQDVPLADPSMYQDEVTPVKWRELAQEVREPEFDGDSWAEDYVRYNSGIRDRVAIAAMQEVIRDSETMSPQQLMAKSAAALAEYEQAQANKPYGEPYTEAEQILLTTLYSQYSLYDSAARNPAFIEDMKAEIFNEEQAQHQRERLDSFDDADAPPEMEAPYQPSQEVTVDDPFEDRDWYEVSNRKVKAYMYENPEVKPFFQEEAAVMLDELNSTTKGERWYDDHVYYDSGGEAGWGGTKRHTSDSIAEMLDGWKMSYDDIEKGLKAIIEDHGAENIAAAKKIEFMLNDRLLNGYTSFVGFEPTMDKWGNVPPNQSYLAMLEEKQVTEYSKEAFDALMAEADRYAPVGISETETTTPVAIAENATTTDDIAPVAPAYEVVSDKKGDIKGQQAITKEDAATGKTAKILVEEPEVEKKQSVWSKFKNLVLDKGMVFEDLSIRTGNRELQARWNSIRYARNKAQRLMEKGNASVSSLDSIRKTVEEKGKEYTQKFYEYLYHMHNIDRMSLETEENRVKREELQVQFQGYTDEQLSDLATSWITKDTPQETTDRIKAAREYVEAKKNGNKPVFGDDVTADISRKTASKMEKANPEFKEYAKEVYGYMNYLRGMLVDNGVISNETAKLWAEMYPHYVPIRRLGDTGLNINVPLDTGRTGVNAPVKRATGGSRDILPLFDTMGQRTMQTFSAVAKNRFGVELKNTLGTTIGSEAMGLDEAINSIDTQDGLLQEGKKGKKPTFTVFEDGKRVTFEITEEMYDAMKPTSDALAYTNKVASAVSDFRRNTLTQYNPWFMLKNAIKDVQDVLINSQHAARTYVTIPKAISQMVSNGQWYTEYMENGGEDNSYFDSQTNTFKSPNPTIEAIKKYTGLNAIAKANNIIERLPRLAEYIASREAGRSIDVAMLDAARVTTNFAAGGDLTKFLNRNGATFLNASFQGAMQQVRNVREAKAAGVKGVLNLAAKFAVAGLPALALNALIWGDDEEYDELSDYVKQSYYIVGKTEDGKFIRIPKGRTVAVIQNGFEQMQHLITGDDEADLGTFLDLLLTNLAPNNPIDNNILSPIIDVAQNKTWYGEDLVPTRLQDVPNAEQYDESTDSLSRWLGETFNVSPYKTNYLLDQYGGIIGDTFLPMLTPEAESGNDTLAGNLIAPLKDMFTTDSVMNNQNVSDFYDTKDELTKAANSMYATDEDVLKAKYMNSVNSEMGKLYGEKRELQNSDMPDAEKYEAVREVQRQIDELAKSGLDTYNEVLVSGGYATVGDRHYRKKDGEWSKLTDEQLEKQEEVTSGLGISPADYWSDKEEYDFAYEKPEKYAVAKAVGGYSSYKDYSDELYDIKADKDENGDSIRNSRKEKVIDWVNNLDADYGTRIILFKNEYNADDTYNYDIIEYLNNRDDISYAEMETILKELGFDVDANGNISWD